MGDCLRFFLRAASGIALAFLCAGPGEAIAQLAAPGWLADRRTGCKVWMQSLQPNHSVTWSGTCANGLANGTGVLQWSYAGQSDERYDGEVRDGKRHGRGVNNRSRFGDRYDGEWRDDLRHGHAVVTYHDGSRFEGEYRDDKRNGRGIFAYANGDRYDGNFRDHRADGSGTFKLSDGTVYSGNWSKGCFNDGNRQTRLGTSKEACGFK